FEVKGVNNTFNTTPTGSHAQIRDYSQNAKFYPRAWEPEYILPDAEYPETGSHAAIRDCSR
ncbi:hypothetical protein JW935_26445, partial [candidate division KSB1 bacterium]|nr:hypothetical protein [candidate division KSB1 bacterium]